MERVLVRVAVAGTEKTVSLRGTGRESRQLIFKPATWWRGPRLVAVVDLVSDRR